MTSLKDSRNEAFNEFCKSLCSHFQENSKYKKDFPCTDHEECEDCPLKDDDQNLLKNHWRSCISKIHSHPDCINGEGVVVAFLDSGLCVSHKAFFGQTVVVNDVTDSGNIDVMTDHSGHGTMCASIACGRTFTHRCSGKRSIEIPAGVAPNASIVMYKITNKQGRVDPGLIPKALKQCLQDKLENKYDIDIVLLTSGSDVYCVETADTIRKLINARVLVVTAPGNDGLWKDISFPSRSGNTICVGGHNEDGIITETTRTGRALDFLAPGKNILAASSKHPTAVSVNGGTSFAAAHVAGLLALIIQYSKNSEVKRALHDMNKAPPYSVDELVHNQDVMKIFLRKMSKFRKNGEDKNVGYGCLDLKKIFCGTNKFIDALYENIFTDLEN